MTKWDKNDYASEAFLKAGFENINNRWIRGGNRLSFVFHNDIPEEGKMFTDVLILDEVSDLSLGKACLCPFYDTNALCGSNSSGFLDGFYGPGWRIPDHQEAIKRDCNRTVVS